MGCNMPIVGSLFLLEANFKMFKCAAASTFCLSGKENPIYTVRCDEVSLSELIYGEVHVNFRLEQLQSQNGQQRSRLKGVSR